jgi:hypothetical protein
MRRGRNLGAVLRLVRVEAIQHRIAGDQPLPAQQVAQPGGEVRPFLHRGGHGKLACELCHQVRCHGRAPRRGDHQAGGGGIGFGAMPGLEGEVQPGEIPRRRQVASANAWCRASACWR